MDGKSEEWRKAADQLLETLIATNKYVVSDMLIIFLESAGYGLKDYSPLGGVFRRAASRGLITRVDRQTKQALWLSKVYQAQHNEVPHLVEGELVRFKNFGGIDHVTFQIAEVTGETLRLERVK